MEHSVQRLDDLYYMTAHIYSEQNAARPPETTFAHFVEVCGMLATYDRRKKREEFDIEDGAYDDYDMEAHGDIDA